GRRNGRTVGRGSDALEDHGRRQAAQPERGDQVRPEQHGGERAAPLRREQPGGKYATHEAAQQDREIGRERAEPGAGEPERRAGDPRGAGGRGGAKVEVGDAGWQRARGGHADRLSGAPGKAPSVYTPAGTVLPRQTTTAPITLSRASTLPGQITALAATQTPSSMVIGWQKKRKPGSFQSWLPVNR